MAKRQPKFRVLKGISYTPDGADEEVRAEEGDIVNDLPESSIPSLKRMDAIEPYTPKKGGK